MNGENVLSSSTTSAAGILLLSVVGIAYGGTFLLRVVAGSAGSTDFQRSWFRAGHAHAGVLVLLSLVVLVYLDLASLAGVLPGIARAAVPASAVLMPAGFFFGAMGRGRTTPNAWRSLLWAGALALTIGTISLGLALVGL